MRNMTLHVDTMCPRSYRQVVGLTQRTHIFMCLLITSKLFLCNLRVIFVIKELTQRISYLFLFFKKTHFNYRTWRLPCLKFLQKQCVLTVILPAKRQREPASGFKYCQHNGMKALVNLRRPLLFTQSNGAFGKHFSPCLLW